MSRTIFTFFFITISIFLYSQNLPFPKNDMLYTEFTSTKNALYLKKSIITNGFIVMDGVKRFLYKQLNPILIEIRQYNGKLTFKKENSLPVEIPESQNGDNITFLFNRNNSFDNFVINKKIENNKDFYLVKPKKIDKIDKIELTAKEDVIFTIKIYFKDKSTIFYEFKNTITGIQPNGKYFD